MGRLKGFIFFLSVLIALTCAYSGLPSPLLLKVHFLNVGQGDSIYVQTPNGKHILIDAGEREYGPRISNYLRNQGVQKVDLLVATHPHTDHMGGLAQIIRDYEVGSIYLPDVSNTTATFQEFLIAIKQKNQGIFAAKAGFKVDIDPALNILFLAPSGEFYNDFNDYSAVLKITFKQTSFLLCGDAETASEDEMLKSNADLKADVIKVAHHGSSTSSSIKFLERVRPELAIISVGRGNAFGLPSADLLRRLSAFNIGILRTDVMGTIILASDGERIWLEKSQ